MSEPQSEITAVSRPKKARAWWAERPRHHKAGIIAGATVATIVLALVLFLAVFDWNMARGPVSHFASVRAGRDVRIAGNLHVKLLSWNPSATVEGLTIGNPKGVAGNLAEIPKLAVSVKLTSLLRGKVILPYLVADQPNVVLLRGADGTNNWTFKGKSPGEPTRLPAIRRFEINTGKLRLDDKKRKMILAGTISSSEMVGDRKVEGFRLRGAGILNKEPFKLDLTGGPLLNVDPNRPYPFNADLRAGATHVAARGSITKPFDLGVFKTTLDISGPDLADLYYLTGLALPNTPPYRVSGQFTRDVRQYDYTGLDGRIGDSDLFGRLGVTTGERVMLTGDLTSRNLDFDDLAAILGGAPSTKKGESASAKEVKMAQTAKAQQRLLPDAPLRVERLRGMDAKVSYAAATVHSQRFPVRKASVKLTLDKGLLTLNQLTFGLTRGQVAGTIAINARQDIPIVDLDMKMTGGRIEQFLPAKYAENSVNGGLVGRAKLHGRGRSVREAAASADGNVALVVPNGEIRKAFAELLGVNVVKGLGLLLTKNEDKTDIRCGVADFQAKNGVLYAQRFMIDTGPVLAQGGGTVSLRDETMDLHIKGEPKEFRLVRLMLPIKLQGPLTAPKFGVDTSKVVTQVGLAAAVGAVLAPLAAVLPFVDSGLADDANCNALIAGAGKARAVPKADQVAQAAKPARN